MQTHTPLVALVAVGLVVDLLRRLVVVTAVVVAKEPQHVAVARQGRRARSLLVLAREQVAVAGRRREVALAGLRYNAHRFYADITHISFAPAIR